MLPTIPAKEPIIPSLSQLVSSIRELLIKHLKQGDFTICTEFLIKSYKNFKCKEILSKERKRLYGISKVNKLFDGVKILLNILTLFFKIK